MKRDFTQNVGVSLYDYMIDTLLERSFYDKLS